MSLGPNGLLAGANGFCGHDTVFSIYKQTEFDAKTLFLSTFLF